MNDLRTSTAVPLPRKRRETWRQAAWRLHGDTIVTLSIGLGGLASLWGLLWGLVRLQQRYPQQAELVAKIFAGAVFFVAALFFLWVWAMDINAQRKETEDG